MLARSPWLASIHDGGFLQSNPDTAQVKMIMKQVEVSEQQRRQCSCSEVGKAWEKVMDSGNLRSCGGTS